MERIGKYEFMAEPFQCDFSGRMFLGHLGNQMLNAADFSGRMFLGHLGNQMLNAADFHSTERGFGMKYLMTIKRSWVLSRLAIEMEEMPSQHELCSIETWVEGAMRYFTSRNFCVSDGKGRIYGYGRSIWAMIDTETRQPTDIYAIDNGAINNWIVDDKPCPIERGGRVKMDENAMLIRTLDVNYNDIDINGHVNSMKYIEHVLDLWDVDWYREHRLKRFEIAYVAEARQGEKLSFYRERTADNECCVRLTKANPLSGNEVEVCRCKLVFVVEKSKEI